MGLYIQWIKEIMKISGKRLLRTVGILMISVHPIGVINKHTLLKSGLKN
jgi:hypothetical protein